MRPYSLDIRERVVAAVDAGEDRSEIVRLFRISNATIKRYLRKRREVGNLGSKSPPGRVAVLGDALRDGLAAQVAAHPDATLAEHCALWATAHQQPVSTASVSRALAALRLTRKKRRSGPASGTTTSGRPGTPRRNTSSPSVSSGSTSAGPTRA
jgi:transposase